MSVFIVSLALLLAIVLKPDPRVREVLGTANDPVINAFSASSRPIYEKPSKLIIDNLNIDINLVEVNVEEDGAMEAPLDWFTGGWYKEGAKPGEQGNLIINAHYDTDSGIPAAFWELKKIKVGDTVVLVDELGRIYTYEVNEIFFLGINDPDRLKIFEGDGQKPTLTLITCGGIWLPGNYTYSQRLIVKGELVE